MMIINASFGVRISVALFTLCLCGALMSPLSPLRRVFVQNKLGSPLSPLHLSSSSDHDPRFPPVDLPSHPSNANVHRILENAQTTIESLTALARRSSTANREWISEMGHPQKKAGKVHANSYVDLGLVKAVGFDYDYTLVQYTNALLELIYDMSLNLLMSKRNYPPAIKECSFDKSFPIRGLAVDRKTGWICHLSYTHKVSLAYEGHEKVSRDRIRKEFSGKRSMNPGERAKRLKPLNDLFSMSECALVADVVQALKDAGVPFHPASVVTDVSKSIGDVHISGDFHRVVAGDPGRSFESTPDMAEVLRGLRESGKTMVLISNSPFWYVDAGMRYNFGEGWRDTWDVIVAAAGKPLFYTDKARPFREVVVPEEGGGWDENVSFEAIDELIPGRVYTEGCLTELIRLKPELGQGGNAEGPLSTDLGGGGSLNSNVLYVGDSLFADLVDAKREFGWYTAGVLAELREEVDALQQDEYVASKETIEVLLCTLRVAQNYMDPVRTKDDKMVLDAVEKLVSQARDRMNKSAGNSKFGSIFRARHQTSLFGASVTRYCDLYFGSVEALKGYSPMHRFYPDTRQASMPHQEAAALDVERAVLFMVGGDEDGDGEDDVIILDGEWDGVEVTDGVR